MNLTTFKLIRIICLLIILAIIAFYTKAQTLDSRAWLEPLEVVIFPINAEDSDEIDQYIAQLNDSDFAAIDRFLKRESKYYDIITNTPTQTVIGPTLESKPPTSPSPDANILKIMWWSMNLRYWAYRNTPDNLSKRNTVQIFVLYHEAQEGKRLKHSFGLNKGLIGLVHAFASPEQQAQNNIVIAHELLHTVGASDKYGKNGAPIFPDGFANPDATELYPQKFAEIMAGRIPISETNFRMARNLRLCSIGEKTAHEINWFKMER